MDIGCVRMTERHLTRDPPTAEEIAAAEEDVARPSTRRSRPCLAARRRPWSGWPVR